MKMQNNDPAYFMDFARFNRNFMVFFKKNNGMLLKSCIFFVIMFHG